MRVLRLHGREDLRLEEAPAPTPGPGEVAIDVAAVGVCASDVHYYLHGGLGGLKAEGGFVLGHELSGRVAEVGPPAVHAPLPEAAPDLRVGQAVTVEPGRPCGACRECGRGDYHLCRGMRFFGTPPTHGSLCDRVVCPAEWVFPLPDGVSLPEGAMMEPLAVGVFAAELADLRGGERCAVVGCGAIGLSVLQALKVSGAGPVHVEDPIAFRRDLAVSLGAEADAPTPGESDVAAECAGTPEAIGRALDLARPGGLVLVVGIPDEDVLSFSASQARRKGLTLRFVRRYRHCFPRALRWTAEGRVRVAPYLTHRFPLERTTDAFRLAAARSDNVLRAWIDLSLRQS